MAAAKKKPVSKDDLRRLMKEQQSASKSISKRIDSPLAKYNSLGNLVCVVCNSQVKSELLWNAHILGRTHKENIDALKSKSKEEAHPVPSEATKRKMPDMLGDASTKRSRSMAPAESSAASSMAAVDQASVQNRVPRVAAQYSSSSEDEEDDAAHPSASATASSQSNNSGGAATAVAVLPADFFDSSAKGPSLPSSKSEKVAEVLPEGFFDDPKQDAKIRQVEYKDKLEDEWEMFQKAMKEETIASEAIIAEEDEQATEERRLDEVDEQISRWSRVDQLGKKKDQLMETKKPLTSADSDEEAMDIEGKDFDEFFDWRSKNAWT